MLTHLQREVTSANGSVNTSVVMIRLPADGHMSDLWSRHRSLYGHVVDIWSRGVSMATTFILDRVVYLWQCG